VMLKINLEETVYEDVGWTHVAQNTVQWQAVVNTIRSL
jgi:hypothetical protein